MCLEKKDQQTRSKKKAKERNLDEEAVGRSFTPNQRATAVAMVDTVMERATAHWSTTAQLLLLTTTLLTARCAMQFQNLTATLKKC